MRYEILNGANVINTILASAEYMTANYASGTYRLAVDVIPVVVPNTKITRLAYLIRLGDELEAIYTLAQSNVKVQIYRDKVLTADCIDLTDPEVIAGLNLMKTAGIYTSTRVTEILTNAITPREAFTG
ncbi:hypothetical protein [Undibacterium sp. Ren11W]|uniref:hypothetical protein n=1 Tax=Undibacterium sp. Ren11W TaxID=3413045 RepID=UPI003BF25B08